MIRKKSSDFRQYLSKEYIDNIPTENWFLFFKYISKNYKVSFILITLASFISFVELTLLSKMIENFTLWFAESPSYSTFVSLSKNLIYLSLVYCLIETVTRIGNYISCIYVPKVEATTRVLVTQKVLNYSYDFFITRPEGEIVNKINDITDGISDIFEFSSTKLIPALLQILISFYLIGSRNIMYLAIFLYWVFLHCFLSYILSNSCAKKSKNTFLAQADLASLIVDIFSNIFVIKSFHTEENESANFVDNQEKESWNYHKFLKSVNFMKIILSILYIFFITVSNLFLLYAWYSSKVTPADVVFLFSMALTTSFIIWSLMSELPEIFTAIGQCQASLSILNNKYYDERFINPSQLEDNTRLNGDIIFENVCFKTIINNISLKIKAGQKIAIIGTSGSGKSTLLSLILGILKPTSGKIFIEDHEINTISSETLKKNIAVVTQDSFIFNRTLKENICCGQSFTQEQIDDALQKAELDSFVKSKEEKMNFKVGNKGRKLSGGQRQRLNIARVFIRDPSIVLCDEAASALDPKTDISILKNLFKVYEDKTMLVVTHDVSITTKFDLIILMEDGQIVEMGTPGELIEKKGIYCQLLSLIKE